MAPGAAATFEGVQQPEPVADFMYGRLALIERVHIPARHGGDKDVAAVVDVGGWRPGRGYATTGLIGRGGRGGLAGDNAGGGGCGGGELAVAE